MIEKCFGALLFLLLVSVKSTNGIKCYHSENGGYGKLVDCDSRDAKGWKVAVVSANHRPFRNVSRKGWDGWDEQSPNACVKFTYSSDYPDFATSPTRTCMVAEDFIYDKYGQYIGCTNQTITGQVNDSYYNGLVSYTRNLETCICYDNLCNRSQSTIAGVFFVMVTAVTSIAIAKFFS